MSTDRIIYVEVRILADSEADAQAAIRVLRESVGTERITFDAPKEGQKRGDWLAYGELTAYIPGPVPPAPPDWRNRR